jgi:hypothetical protein
MTPEIEKDEKDFIKTMFQLLSDINIFLYHIAVGKDYDDDATKKLFSIYKFLKKG